MFYIRLAHEDAEDSGESIVLGPYTNIKFYGDACVSETVSGKEILTYCSWRRRWAYDSGNCEFTYWENLYITERIEPCKL